MAHINDSRQVVGVYFRPERAVQSKDGCYWIGGEASDGSGTMWVRYLLPDVNMAASTLRAGVHDGKVVQGRHQGGNLVYDLPHEEWGYDCYRLTGFVNLVTEQEAIDWATARDSDWLQYAKEEEDWDDEPLLPSYSETEPEPKPVTHPDLTARDWAIRIMTRLMGAMTTGTAETIAVPCGYVCVDEHARFMFVDRDGQPLRATLKRGAVDNVTLKKLEAMLEELAAKG